MKRRIYIYMMILTGISIFYSCKKTLDVSSSHQVPLDKMWQSRNDARSALFGTYGLLRAALANENAYLAYGDLRSGDFKSVSDMDIRAVTDNDLNATSDLMEEWKNWRRFYAVIAQANLCLKQLPVVHETDFRYTDDLLRLDIANVRFIRALAYFYLVRIWGDVPLVTHFSMGKFEEVNRSDQQMVLDFAQQDALLALNDLPWQYNGSSPEQEGKYWDQDASFWKGKIATKASVYALLAHIAAWRGKYLDAVIYSKLILDNKSLAGLDFAAASSLTSSSGGVFKGQADNIIFFLSANSEYQESSTTGHIENWTLAEPFIDRATPIIYVPNDSIISIFDEKGDKRFSLIPNEPDQGSYFTGFGNPIPIFSKIKLITSSGGNPLKNFESGIVIFRYEEIELLQAEAYYFLGLEEDALKWLNAARDQRGLPEFEGSGEVLGDAILRERRRELMGEGWRWYDLIRFDKVAEYTNLSKDEIEQGALVWPISNDILTGNTKLEQNNFWLH